MRMESENMSVYTIVQLFRQELLTKYPKGEVEQFIALAFEDVLKFSRVDLIMKTNDQIPYQYVERFFGILESLKQFKPIQYVLGKTVFYGLPIQVNRHVLIPRPETEELVHWILKHEWKEGITVLDLGTGSGCIALALKDHLKKAVVHGADISVEALNVAKKNALNNNLLVDFFRFDIISQESLGFMKYDLMVSNPPYVRMSEKEWMEKNVLNHEPHPAIFVDEEEPLIFYRKIVDLAQGHLKPGGMLFFEINEAYGAEVVQLLKDRDFENVTLKQDFNGKDRMVSGLKS